MSDQHLVAWIRFFREKFRRDLDYQYRSRGLVWSGTVADVDEAVCYRLVTGPAIYRRAAKRGLLRPDGSLTLLPDVPAPGGPAVVRVVSPPPDGERVIRFDRKRR